MRAIKFGNKGIGEGFPTYFVADISANHDGSLERAKMLVQLAAEAGADAAKFQNFRAREIVSAEGFEALGGQVSHQAKWRKSVVEVYDDASVPWEWTADLKEECERVGIDYFSTPYDLEAVDMLDEFGDLYKIGSGDITWTEMLLKVAGKGKPTLLATGASNIGDVQRAVDAILSVNPDLVLMQCNTNYTASTENFQYIHLNVLKTLSAMFEGVVLGLSDHTMGHSTVLGAVALGAKCIEKHFTDDNDREGPDHSFSMTPTTWRAMVDATRELELALGDGNKRVAANEEETVVIQRRCLRAGRDLQAGHVVNRHDLAVLRPAPPDSIKPYDLDTVLGMGLVRDVAKGTALQWGFLEAIGGH